MHDTSEVKQSNFRMKNILLHFMLCWILHSTKCSVTKQPDYNQTKELQNRNQSEEHPCNRCSEIYYKLYLYFPRLN